MEIGSLELPHHRLLQQVNNFEQHNGHLARQQQDKQDFHDRLTAIINAPDDLMPELALQNQIAKRKAALLLKKESEWF